MTGGRGTRIRGSSILYSIATLQSTCFKQFATRALTNSMRRSMREASLVLVFGYGFSRNPHEKWKEHEPPRNPRNTSTTTAWRAVVRTYRTYSGTVTTLCYGRVQTTDSTGCTVAPSYYICSDTVTPGAYVCAVTACPRPSHAHAHSSHAGATRTPGGRMPDTPSHSLRPTHKSPSC